ncbi:MAG: hypothetical protein LBS83_02875 [Holosporales bacterium]|nr:hypothetical protein [Holosporales bacterium]
MRKILRIHVLFIKVFFQLYFFLKLKDQKIIIFIPKPQKIADSNFLSFKDWQQLKSEFFGGPSYTLTTQSFFKSVGCFF